MMRSLKLALPALGFGLLALSSPHAHAATGTLTIDGFSTNFGLHNLPLPHSTHWINAVSMSSSSSYWTYAHFFQTIPNTTTYYEKVEDPANPHQASVEDDFSFNEYGVHECYAIDKGYTLLGQSYGQDWSISTNHINVDVETY